LTATFYRLGQVGSADDMVGYLDEHGLFHWEMPRTRFELVITGQAGRHCDTCQCERAQTDGAVIEDTDCNRYTLMQFAMYLASTRGEIRNDA
jgi:hypothetical protein